MNRDEFLARLAPLDDAQLKKVLWNLYWRGSAVVRERIEGEIEVGTTGVRGRAAPEVVDPHEVRREVDDFVSLARSGAYLGGDRRVSPKERVRWRFTFKRLVAEAGRALANEDLAPGAAAMEALVDIACETREYDLFRSEDPVEAAKIVVSDEVALLWSRVFEHSGFPAFASLAAPQLIRWESRFGWTRTGYGQIADREISLAGVLVPMLRVPDAWITFTDRYLDALDEIASRQAGRPRRSWQSPGREPDRRAESLAGWHQLLLQRLVEDEAADGRADRLATHPALGGPELTYLQARLAHQRGDVGRARDLMHASLTERPGHADFLTFATEIGARLPPR